MKRSEMLKVLQETLDRICGCCPETGERLYPYDDYLIESFLRSVEEFMELKDRSPVDYCEMRDWESEDEE